jgi:hypothetical protein
MTHDPEISGHGIDLGRIGDFRAHRLGSRLVLRGFPTSALDRVW